MIRSVNGPCVLLATLAVVLAGCGDDSMTDPPGLGTVVVQLDNVVGNDPLALNTGQYTNAAGNQYSVSLLEYVLSDFHLHTAANPASRANANYEEAIAHYRNQADESTREITLTDVPAGDYAEIEFVFGINGSKNVDGAYPDLDLLGMAWPQMMGGGYHYMRNEGTYTDASQQTAGFLTHVGPSMGNDFSFQVSLDHDFTVAADGTTTIRVVMNVNEWYEDPTVYDFNDHGTIMGSPATQAILQANGASVWSVAP